MKRTNKKGFTIVELVIVIAVIAILAAVLIPNISRLVKKANQSADIQLVRNMNTALQIEGNGATHYDTAHDAITAAAKAGYDLTKIAVSDKDNAILWDEKYQCFAYLKSGSNELEYVPNSKAGSEDTPNEQLWMVYSEKPADGFKYSVYWIGGDEAIEVSGLGFDAGDHTVSNVTYKNANGKSVVVRTNGGALTIDAESDTINHYGVATFVDVKAVANKSYHVYGTVGFINVIKGRVTVETTGKVITVYASASTVTIENNSGKIENAYAASGVNANGNVKLIAIPEGKTIEEIKNESEIKSVAVAKVGDAYQISLEAAFTKALTMENATIEILTDVDLSLSKWTPVDVQSSNVTKKLVINGNNHTITGLNVHMAATNDPKGDHQAGASNFYGVGFIGRVNNGQELEINNLTFSKAVIDDTDMQSTASNHTSGVAVVVGISYGTTRLNDVNVKNSSVYGGEKVGAMIGFSVNYTDYVNGGSVSDTTVTCTYYYSALVIGMASVKPSVTNVKVVNNSNTYDSSCSYASETFFTTEEGNTRAYVDGYWMMVAYKFAIAGYGGFDDVELTHNNITAKSNGHSYDYTKNGDFYSIN